MTRVALRLSDRTDLANEIFARKIIELAKAGSASGPVVRWRAAEFSGAARIKQQPPFPSLPGSY
jgi:hypothetical protein